MNTQANAKITSPGGERTLIERARVGDRTAFATLYNDNQQVVYRYFYVRVRNRQLAEDLTQEVFVRALRRISAFQFQGSNIQAWLVTIARNLYFDHLKSARTRYERPTDEFFEAVEQDRSAETDAMRELEVVEAADTVRRAMSVLNPSQRRCVELRYLHGLSGPETAAKLKITVGAVKSMTFRAMEEMRAELRAPKGMAA
ncbi:sigma-70 family RNA polymerase sigma factor [Streptomyces sp. DSM 3412]|uniref:RNA polymerase sigma factor n=1 Tax=Streptomyces gottesmaniae TaxID=3075518 RepID=A0ABU2YU67_9ACTN|nr:sigma-70 family RNA polymerase sigma factor [Streptomyces sp. DSM 3412]MDT0567865.1 sigma-70 family RNA polymerase sigma factor [Streptomyces sp. DSM 3412]